MAREVPVPASTEAVTRNDSPPSKTPQAPSPSVHKAQPRASVSSLAEGMLDYRGRCGCDCGCARSDGQAFWCRECRRVVLAKCCGRKHRPGMSLLRHSDGQPEEGPLARPGSVRCHTTPRVRMEERRIFLPPVHQAWPQLSAWLLHDTQAPFAVIGHSLGSRLWAGLAAGDSPRLGALFSSFASHTLPWHPGHAIRRITASTKGFGILGYFRPRLPEPRKESRPFPSNG